MKKNILLGLIFASLAFPAGAQEKKINVYAFMAEECPISIFMAASLKSVSEMYGENANFFLVFPVSSSNEKTANAFKKKHQLQRFSVVVDSSQLLTKTLGAKVTPEVVIINDQSVLLYKGRINDAYSQPGKRKHIFSNHDLAEALQRIVAGEPAPTAWKPAIGCIITLKKRAS
ncbi:MAG: hypothetical protein EOO13_10790 [Chitinophagaceae bacterium]|nr:MAG: hypothetical protein EOO13_10790 [Chitinophagaceae bacterium]